MDTSWINLPRDSEAYIKGVSQFMELARENLIEGRSRCPCKRCKLDKWLAIDDVEYHIRFKGFYDKYTTWIFHGKQDILEHIRGEQETSKNYSIDELDSGHGTRELLRDTFGLHIPSFEHHNESFSASSDGVQEPHECGQPHQCLTPEEEAKYNRLLEASNEALYPDCTSFSKLSFLLHLFQLKCMFHWPAESVTMLLRLLVDAFPQILEFPSDYYFAKKMIKDLGLSYEKIHACPKNCMLYWGENANRDTCSSCGTSRWRKSKGKDDEGNCEESNGKMGEPAKVVRYFPLVPRLKRLYVSSKTAGDMIWHEKCREKDGNLRHPADGLAWREFDARYPEFSADPRNVRLGLASDGFNPYRLMNSIYSTWPVVLIPYNLPPWLCMKSSSFILSTIIPGKSSPGMDIDVYLQPLLDELKQLWVGVDAFDANNRETFKLRGALMWTINDFPAYAMLSGWSTKGYNACPSCTMSTFSYKFAGKICFTGHRKWLPNDHHFRFRGDLFDGNEEYGLAPLVASGSEVLRQQSEIKYEYGKGEKNTKRKRVKQQVGTSIDDGDIHDEEDEVLWKKKSIFFELPYWEYNLLRHNLDVMHIEKNVCDNLLGTLLNLDKKNRDDEKARRALKELNVKPHLWLRDREGREPLIPPASYSMSMEEKVRFLKVLNKLRVPDGYGSNIARCVNLKQRKLSNLKSHDNHVLMQDILPIALRASKATKIVDLISKLSSFFKYLCSATLEPQRLDEMQSLICETLCEMEIEFLPTFFTVMVHLLIHLSEEAKLGGPVYYRWMYPIERFLAHLKRYVSNKAQPEGSIAEGYLLEETITFCSRYLEGIELRFCRPRRYDDSLPDMVHYLEDSGGKAIGAEKIIRLDDRSLEQAHRYILLQIKEMKPIHEEFLREKRQENFHRGNRADQVTLDQWTITECTQWLQNQVHSFDISTEEGKLRKYLAGGPCPYARKMKGFAINGYKFHTVEHERYKKTQNSGIMAEDQGQVYYGRLTDIYELDYYGAFRVVLFRCDWVDIHHGIKTYNNGVCVNFKKMMHTGRMLSDDPFIISSQAKQVFYVEDEMKKGWLHVIVTKPRNLYDLG